MISEMVYRLRFLSWSSGMAMWIQIPLGLWVLSLCCTLGTLVPAEARDTIAIKLTDPVYPKKPKSKHTLIAYQEHKDSPLVTAWD